MSEPCATGWKRVRGRFRLIAQTELGEEQLCPSCQELWPLDPEFYAEARGGIGYECRACIRERQARAPC